MYISIEDRIHFGTGYHQQLEKTSANVNALFYFSAVAPSDMFDILTRVKQNTRSIDANLASGHPLTMFITYRPNVVDIKDIQHDLKKLNLKAVLITC